jgi:hypothetical protein
MRLTSRSRLWSALCAATLGVGTFVVMIPATPQQTCPFGQIEDTSTPGFQCVFICPTGMMIDALTRTCVAAPGLPPPALP